MYPSGYPAPPPGYVPAYDHFRTPPVSPAPAGHTYYSPRYSVHTATPSPRGSPKVHARRASQDVPPAYTNYPRTPGPGYYAGYSSPRYYPQQSATPAPRRETDYVSGFYYRRSDDYYAPHGTPSPRHRHDGKHRYANSRQYYTVVVEDDHRDYDEAPPPYEERYFNQRYGGADSFNCYQIPIYSAEQPTPQRSRARRASHSSAAKPPPPKPRPSTAKVTPKATEEDARRAGIPAGYSFKNWDPTEEPIMLLGSVFDANSLGKWIYDWTVFHYGPATPMSEIAGEMWLLLIQLAGKVKRAEESMPKIRKKENREMVEDFLESGDRLWMRFAKLLKVCEDYMWKAAKKETGKEKPVSMGKNAGCEFVDTIFGRDRELELTEKLMTSMRLWSMRFDANCEEILRHPTA